MAAQQIRSGQNRIVVAGGLESISLVQNEHMNQYEAQDPWLSRAQARDLHVDAGDRRGRRRPLRRRPGGPGCLLGARASGAPPPRRRRAVSTLRSSPSRPTKRIVDRETGEVSFEEVTLSSDECNRPGTTLDGIAALKPVIAGGTITAGNASQLSDGAAAVVVMDADLAAARGIEPLGRLP